ncbi:hypothetical protein V8G54_013063 [Vigna mungo]|uniref:Uncharacterized protein n=1 Tax=Vigna mungo TaxID=3915 RepID=A0AAQ3S2X2_VIGMU
MSEFIENSYQIFSKAIEVKSTMLDQWSVDVKCKEPYNLQGQSLSQQNLFDYPPTQHNANMTNVESALIPLSNNPLDIKSKNGDPPMQRRKRKPSIKWMLEEHIQLASHAQKYFKRKKMLPSKKKRKSILDVTFPLPPPIQSDVLFILVAHLRIFLLSEAEVRLALLNVGLQVFARNGKFRTAASLKQGKSIIRPFCCRFGYWVFGFLLHSVDVVVWEQKSIIEELKRKVNVVEAELAVEKARRIAKSTTKDDREQSPACPQAFTNKNRDIFPLLPSDIPKKAVGKAVVGFRTSGNRPWFI